MSELVRISAPDVVERVRTVLVSGGTVVLPTDTVYGLAVAATVPRATGELVRLKGRSADQPFAVLVGDVDQALALVDDPSPLVRDWMERWWPGPLTLVLDRGPAARGLDLGGDPDSIGIRCPDHDLLAELTLTVGPLAVTSANRHGHPTPITAQAAASSLGDAVDLVVDGGPAGTVASTVVDARSEPTRVLRAGAITPADLGLEP